MYMCIVLKKENKYTNDTRKAKYPNRKIFSKSKIFGNFSKQVF